MEIDDAFQNREIVYFKDTQLQAISSKQMSKRDFDETVRFIEKHLCHDEDAEESIRQFIELARKGFKNQ